MPSLAPIPRLQDEYGLTELQARFVQEYPACDFNATEAARQAGYSEKTAHAQASRLLKNVKVQAALSEYLNDLTQRAELQAEDVLEEYRRIAFSNLRDVVHWGPDGLELRASDELPDEVAAAVREVEVNEWRQEDGTVRRRVKVKMHRKEKALDKLGEFLGLWQDPHELRVRILQVFAELSTDELAEIEQMEDDEIVELLEDGGYGLPGPL